MKFDSTIRTDQVPDFIDKAIQLGTWKAWKARFRSIDDQLRAGSSMKDHVLRWYEIESAMRRLLEYRSHTGRMRRISNIDASTHRLFNFVASLANVHEQLSTKGAANLASKVRGALTDKSQSLSSLAFELAVITNLMHREVDVFCNDWESGVSSGSGGTFDFLARFDDMQAEIECKTFSADIGRKVHRKRLLELLEQTSSPLLEAISRRGSLLIDTVLAGSLTDAAGVETIASSVTTALASGSDYYDGNACKITIKNVTLEGSPFDTRGGMFVMPDEGTISEFVRTRYGFDNKNTGIIGHPNAGFAFFVVRSRKPDTVADYILDNVKDASKQLSGRLPGVVCAHMLDMNGDEVANLRTPSVIPKMQTEFERIMREFFGDPRRNHVFAARFTAPGEIREQEEILGHIRTNSFRETGVAFHLKNMAHPHFNDGRFEVFL